MVSPAHTFYVIGLGSMGKRRIRNLLALRVPSTKIFGFDPDRKRCREAEKMFGVKTETDFERGFASWKPSVFIVSTPPDKHSKYFLFAAKRKIHFFVEVTTVDDGYQKLLPLLTPSFVAAPSATFRYAPGVLKLREIIEKGVIGKPLFFQHYLGQYLRTSAITRNTVYCLVVGRSSQTAALKVRRQDSNGEYVAPEGRFAKTYILPAGVVIAAIEPAEITQIYFYPDGSADTAALTLVNAYNKTVSIKIKGASGAMQIQ